MTELNQANYNPGLMYAGKASNSWATTGNTDTVTDAQVRASSIILIMHTSAHAGRWYVTPAAGSFVITSSDTETASSTTFKYLVL